MPKRPFSTMIQMLRESSVCAKMAILWVIRTTPTKLQFWSVVKLASHIPLEHLGKQADERPLSADDLFDKWQRLKLRGQENISAGERGINEEMKRLGKEASELYETDITRLSGKFIKEDKIDKEKSSKAERAYYKKAQTRVMILAHTHHLYWKDSSNKTANDYLNEALYSQSHAQRHSLDSKC